MKRLLSIALCISALLLLSQCSISRKVAAKAYPIGFSELHNYFIERFLSVTVRNV